jgi:hypothetical protein
VRIPVDAGHQFRSMSGQDSGPCRATVPVDAGRAGRDAVFRLSFRTGSRSMVF